MGLTKVELKGLDDGTDGQIITYDANGNPVAVGPGTDGQVLTSTGAGSPPAFEDAAAGGAALTGSTNNTITTVTGANAISGEANLTYDGTHLTVGTSTSNTSDAVTVYDPGSVFMSLRSDAQADGNTQALDFGIGTGNRAGGNIVASIAGIVPTGATAGGTLKGELSFSTNAGNSLTERLKITETGNVTVSDGDLVIGTAGHGIDFSATSDATGKDNELLNDYEEGTFTPILNFGGIGVPGYSSRVGTYTKVGNVVHFRAVVELSDKGSNTGQALMYGLPFTNNGGSNYTALSTWNTSMEIPDPHILLSYVGGGATWCKLDRVNDSNGDVTDVTGSNFNDNSQFQLAGSYFTTA